jgi:ectoine hydroxylase-related dioxygenase (phytanoyl-CoA dioxygenase family)
MKINFLDCKKNFDNDGYFICKNVFNKDFIHQLINEIKYSKNSIKYFDNFKNLKRIEKLYDKGNKLKDLNKKISTLLNNVFEEEFLIFKDKFNAKPPGGEGFFAHYDGIFHFINPNNEKKNGWYEYGDFFVNALVALDECNKENGAFEIANIHRGNFDQLIENTKKDGTPALTKETEIKTSFKLINLNVGDMVVFSNTCPHRSKNNDSNKSRRIIYYTYSLSKNGSKYKKYFDDKENSKNTSKALDAN